MYLWINKFVFETYRIILIKISQDVNEYYD
jgi:hypothetical protein